MRNVLSRFPTKQNKGLKIENETYRIDLPYYICVIYLQAHLQFSTFLYFFLSSTAVVATTFLLLFATSCCVTGICTK